jgi:hypothetical protein
MDEDLLRKYEIRHYKESFFGGYIDYTFESDLPLTLSGSELLHLKDQLCTMYKRVEDTGSCFIVTVSKRPKAFGGTHIFIFPGKKYSKILIHSILDRKESGINAMNKIIKNTIIGDKLKEYLDKFGNGQELLDKMLLK